MVALSQALDQVGRSRCEHFPSVSRGWPNLRQSVSMNVSFKRTCHTDPPPSPQLSAMVDGPLHAESQTKLDIPETLADSLDPDPSSSSQVERAQGLDLDRGEFTTQSQAADMRRKCERTFAQCDAAFRADAFGVPKNAPARRSNHIRCHSINL